MASGGAPGLVKLDKAVVNLEVLREHALRQLGEALDAAGSATVRPATSSLHSTGAGETADGLKVGDGSAAGDLGAGGKMGGANQAGALVKKALVLDPKVSGPLGLVAELPFLRAHGVGPMYHLQPGRLDTPAKTVVYLVRPLVAQMKAISEHIHYHHSLKQQKDYYVYFLPRRTMVAERALEEHGVYADITIGELPLDLIPFDTDLLSLELGGSYRECFLENDCTSLFYVARSLMKLQCMFGLIPNIKGKGQCAQQVKDMMLRMRREMGGDEPTIAPEIDTLILIDRQVDMVSPMATQLTYEGLIDEVFGISNGFVYLDPEMLPAPEGDRPKPKGKVPTPLNSNDEVYNKIRDQNFSVVGPRLNAKAREIKAYYEKKEDVKKGLLSTTEIRDFVRKYKNEISKEEVALQIHINVAEEIHRICNADDFHDRLEREQSVLLGDEYADEYIEDCISKKDPLLKVLRLLCLQSLTKGGFKPKQLDFFRREILQTYGYEYMRTLLNLSALGLLTEQKGARGFANLNLFSSNFATVAKNLNLIDTSIDVSEPGDIHYVYSGYAPISVRLVEMAFKPGWRAIENSLSLLPGPTFEIRQQLPPSVRQTTTKTRPVTLVFHIGGLTYAELAAYRYLSQGREGRDIIIATTKMISGDSILESVIDNTLLKQDMRTDPGLSVQKGKEAAESAKK
mmetsp:Transcript_14721/g.37457  ORF Transcript_14721/g.37457 Transcript_14721/m.37457 type:complete len:683 (-) Transcript_14721:54-2102(-)|eukprot:CAMPEP_0177658050 /NCGR_PEP_ID=MMETSP0447-20121125/16581_1 /TAXON_ID=0 /ORGANISM="Stygamoeba regulata, Strain BSH-02190019" /LENGTH=682 /DNA_ID=CAMNT_0019162585 /DNA_START=101 /DNA_END=2152 /DNA_ORIENTATION=+